MRRPRNLRLLFLFTSCSLLFAACSGDPDNAKTTVTTAVSPPAVQALTVASRPQSILNLMEARGEDKANPTLMIVRPAANAVISGSKVEVLLDLGPDSRGYMPHKDPATGTGNHIHVILDNEPYEAYYEMEQPFELRNVSEGKHTLRVFASRPWHESYKNDGSFQMITFTVKRGGDASKPTTTGSGQTMANANNNSGAASQAPREGKDMAASKGGDVDPTKPLLTYSRPKGEYKGEDTAAIMIDFWLTNARLKGDGGEYRVRYFVNDDEARYIDKWEPIWLSGWIGGKHTVRLELLDKDGRPVENGGYNTTTRTITVVK